MAQARDYVNGIYPPAYDSAGGLDEGDVTIISTPASDGTPQAVKPSGSAPWLQLFYGIMQAIGLVGGSGANAGEAIAVKTHGLGRMKVALNQAITRGAQLIADATTLGAVKARTQYSFSAQVLGIAHEALSSSASIVQKVEAFIQPYFVEIVRQVTAGATTALGAATKYATAPGQAGAASQIALYRARFAGEVVRNLSMNVATAPGGSDTVVATVQKSSDNGATWSDTAITCTVSAAGKSATDLTNTATLAAGDLLAVKLVSSNVTAAGVTCTFDVT